MVKDPETNIYRHNFIVDNLISNLNLELCSICNDKIEFHKENQKQEPEPITIQQINIININQINLDVCDENCCRICCDNKLNPDNLKEKLPCEHIFCEFCIEKHIKTCIDNGYVKQFFNRSFQ